MATPQGFLEALPFPRRAAEIPDEDDIFGFLVGGWELDAVLYFGGEVQRIKGELLVSWVLEGRAIQDLFIYPRRADRTIGVPLRGDRYATTIRTYDRNGRGWRIIFINPAAPETSAQLLARRNGSDIAIEGKLMDGTEIRWKYTEITPSSFHYSAERLRSDGKSWEMYLELFGKRVRG